MRSSAQPYLRARCIDGFVRPAREPHEALPRRVAVLSVHTSPLAQPGTGDAGGMNVYVLQTALHLARRGVEVEIFTRATSSADPPLVPVAPGVLVRNVVAGPFEGLDKNDLPTQLCAFTAGVLRAEANHEPGHYDVVHSHYWLSGQVGWLARDRWAVPLVHTAHTLAAVKNAALADGDTPEPPLRSVGEQQVVDEADRLIVNTEDEAHQLVSLHHADPERIDVVHPGVDLQTFTPGDSGAARAALGLSLDLVDRLAKNIQWFDEAKPTPGQLKELGVNPADPTIRHLATLTAQLRKLNHKPITQVAHAGPWLAHYEGYKSGYQACSSKTESSTTKAS